MSTTLFCTTTLISKTIIVKTLTTLLKVAIAHQEVWKHIYSHLNSRFGFDVWQYAQGKKDLNYLEIIDGNGQLENLYTIAVELLTLS